MLKHDVANIIADRVVRFNEAFEGSGMVTDEHKKCVFDYLMSRRTHVFNEKNSIGIISINISISFLKKSEPVKCVVFFSIDLIRNNLRSLIHSGRQTVECNEVNIFKIWSEIIDAKRKFFRNGVCKECGSPNNIVGSCSMCAKCYMENSLRCKDSENVQNKKQKI